MKNPPFFVFQHVCERLCACLMFVLFVCGASLWNTVVENNKFWLSIKSRYRYTGEFIPSFVWNSNFRRF